MHIMLLYDTMYKLIRQTESEWLSVKSSWESDIFQQLFFDQKSLPVDVTSGVVFNKSLVFRNISKLNLSDLPNSYLGLNYMPIGQHQTSLVEYCYRAHVGIPGMVVRMDVEPTRQETPASSPWLQSCTPHLYIKQHTSTHLGCNNGWDEYLCTFLAMYQIPIIDEYTLYVAVNR